DLHDGAQQRLVALSMAIGLARLEVADDSTAAKYLTAAQDEAERVHAELRELIRGVHPQVLTDRGLPASVTDLADRSPVPPCCRSPLTRSRSGQRHGEHWPGPSSRRATPSLAPSSSR
ncbi:MAG TPA: histidine kinase, partial [Asanoa sp.]|nr:histidine kinase [Asanoa sp.]